MVPSEGSEFAEPSDTARWLELLEDSEVRIAERQDVEDPIAERELADALLDRSRAMIGLQRYHEALVVLDSLRDQVDRLPEARREVLQIKGLALRAQIHAALGEQDQEFTVLTELLTAVPVDVDRPKRMTLRGVALSRQRYLLEQRGDRMAALELDRQIVSELAESDVPKDRVRVAKALWHQAAAAITDEHRFEAGLATASVLTARLADEPDDNVVTVAGLLVSLMNRAVQVSGGVPAAIAWMTLLVAPMTIEHELRSLLVQLRRRIERDIDTRTARSGPAASGIVERLLPASARQRVACYRWVLEARDAILHRAGPQPDPEMGEVCLLARFAALPALGGLGRVREAANLFDSIDGSDPVVIQGLKRLAAASASAGPLGPITAAMLLNLRATALADGDPDIERIAYDDAVAEQRARGASGWLADLPVWLWRPRRLRGRRAA